ncbi:MAG: Decaprenylphosphoryl-beta-D-ribose oxidase [Myxococcota bacterium]|nr:Decaprenylphosphoryl-beta-D-ribose oxidase [Myxococcota bacterium]
MIADHPATLSGWGLFNPAQCRLAGPRSLLELTDWLNAPRNGHVIARGLGRSYGDAAVNENHAVADLSALTRVISFDAQTGVLHAEAGLSLLQIIREYLPRGWFPPVTPGTQYVTLGGCVAADVHGKNHHADGSFFAFVDELELWTPARGVLRCSRASEPGLFRASFGGMGLTGVILTVKLRLRRVESAWILGGARRLRDIHHAMDVLDADASPYSVAWIDCQAAGKSAGRSVLLTGQHASAEACRAARKDVFESPAREPVGIPFTGPSWLLNKFTVTLFNTAYYSLQRETENGLQHFAPFFYPLDGVRDWNRLYGKRGFLQYQTVFPGETARAAMPGLIDRLAHSGRASFLAVLKRFGPGNDSPLSFPFAGYTLALDIPAAPGVEDFFRELDDWTLRHGGRVYLAKDSLLPPQSFRAMYPRVEEFQDIRRLVDPRGMLSSSLSRRVGLG